jgi:hypothetical protein
MRQFGMVDIPQEAFIEALKMGDKGVSLVFNDKIAAAQFRSF